MYTFAELTPLQINFLEDLVKKKSMVAIYLKNGIKLKGRLEGFDIECFLLDHPVLQSVNRSAVSTIAPLFTFETM